MSKPPTPLDLHPNAEALRQQLDQQHHDTTLGHVYNRALEVLTAFHFFTHKGIDADIAVELTAITIENLWEGE